MGKCLGLRSSTYPYEFIEKGARKGVPLLVDEAEIPFGAHAGAVSLKEGVGCFKE